MSKIFDDNSFVWFGDFSHPNHTLKNLHQQIWSQYFYENDSIFLRSESLISLLSGLKPSFLTEELHGDIRQIMWPSKVSPLVFLQKNDEVILIGTWLDEINILWKNHKTIPDIRLPFSLKNRIIGWILPDNFTDQESILSMLIALDFPKIFASKNTIVSLQHITKNRKEFEHQKYQSLWTENIIWNFYFWLHSDTILSLYEENICIQYTDFQIENPWNSEKKDTHFSQTWEISSGKNNTFLLKNQNEIIPFSSGEIMRFLQDEDENDINIAKDALKFAFDTLFCDGNTIINASNFAFRDRENIAQNGIIIISLGENFIHIEMIGIVHSFESQKWHKKFVKSAIEFMKTMPQNEKQPKILLKSYIQQLSAEWLNKSPTVIII